MKLLMIFVTLTAVIFASTQKDGGGKDRMSTKCLQIFKDFDANGDGFMQSLEFDRMRASKRLDRLKKRGNPRRSEDAPSFADIDTNQDKKLSQSEFQVYLRYR